MPVHFRQPGAGPNLRVRIQICYAHTLCPSIQLSFSFQISNQEINFKTRCACRSLLFVRRFVTTRMNSIMQRFAPAALFASLLVASSAAAAEPLVVEIWPGKVPDEPGNIGAERFRMSPALDRKQVEVTE